MPIPLRAAFLRRRPTWQSLAIGAGGLAIALAVALVGLGPHSPIERVDDALFDAGVRLFGSGRPAQHVVVVDIDDASLSAIGQWPWPRYRVASLVQRIAEAHPAAIGLDVLFPEADRSSPASIQDTYRRDFGLDVSIGGVPAGLRDNDGFLGHTIATTDAIASTYFYFDRHAAAPTPPRAGVVVEEVDDRLALPEALGVMANADAIATQTHASGFVNTGPDRDGVVRRLPMLLRLHGAVYPSLSLVAAMRALGETTARVEVGLRGREIRVAGHGVPIDARGAAAVRFEGDAAAYPAVSAVDVLSGAIAATDLQGKVVFVGSSAVGLNDQHPTSVDPHFPGLRIQAAMTESILADRAVGAPTWAPAAAVALCLGAGALLSILAMADTQVLAFAAAAAVLAALLLGLEAGLFAMARIAMPLASPLVAVAVLCLANVALRASMEKRRAVVWRRKLDNARRVTIESMASLAETRDPETGAHIQRTQNYVRAIAEELRRTGHHPDVLSTDYIELLFRSAPLHDIGKVGVPDHILRKPGRLTPEEMEIMKQHPAFGAKVIFSTSAHIEGDNFLAIAGEIAATHHEKWDGTGYPLGLAGPDIPLSGRIMAVADVYDALISRRCYKEPFSHEVSTALMRELRGTNFDPAVLDAFFRVEAQMVRIAADFQDEAVETTVPHRAVAMADV